MGQKCAVTLLILAFLQTGVSNSGISVKLIQLGEMFIMTCVLSGNESMSQVNWEMVRSSNVTKLGIFHPIYGTHIQDQHKDSVKIEGSASGQPSCSLHLDRAAVNDSAEICCIFMTFPSGKLMQCADTRDIVISNDTVKEPHSGGFEQVLWKYWTVLLAACIVVFITLIISIYICWKNCRRRRVFEVQQTYITDQPPGARAYEEELPEPPANQEPSDGFDASKLYAKIKEDLYYGRLWKSYQGRARTQTQGVPPPSRQIYFTLGENPLSPDDKGDSPKSPDTTTSTSPLDNSV